MRILLVNRFFGGGQTPTGRMLRDLAAQFVAQGHAVAVLTSSGAYTPANQTAHVAAQELAFNIVRDFSWTPRLFKWVWFWLHTMIRLPFLSWDRCVVLTDPPFLPLAAWWTKVFQRRSRRIYWWTMDLYPEALAAAGLFSRGSVFYKWLRFLNELALPALDGVIALGERQRARLREYRRWNSGAEFSLVVPPWDERPFPRVMAKDNRVLQQAGWGGRKVALYGGNLGNGHLFEEIVDAARWFYAQGRSDWLIAFVVRGARRAALETESAGLPNVVIRDYFPDAETADLLWSAAVHLVTMKCGWEGIIVPSKIYGAAQTSAPILFIGPPDSDTALEICSHGWGRVLLPGTSGETVARALDELAAGQREPANPSDLSGPRRIVQFVTA